MSDEQIVEVDSWLASYKTLDGYQPPWISVAGRGRAWEANWPILSVDGISSAYAALEADAALVCISISIIYRGSPVYRLDIVPSDHQEGNPYSARKYAKYLPSTFCGSHAHAWEDHRLWVSEHGLGELPFRCPLSPAPAGFDRAFEHLAGQINLTLLPDHRPIELPKQSGFSMNGGRR